MILHVKADQDSVTLKNEVVELTETTTKTLKTTKVDSFKQYLTDYGATTQFTLYYNESNIVAYPTHPDSGVSGVNLYLMPIAECTLLKTDQLKELIHKLNRKIDETEFLNFTRVMAPFCPGLLQLHDAIENISMRKIVSIQRSKDNRGNFAFEMSVKDHGKSTFNPPDFLEFTLPVFKHIDKSVLFKVGFHFDYAMSGVDEDKRAKFKFKLELFNTDQILEEAYTAIMEDQLSKFDCPKYWGSLFTGTRTDEWKYKQLPLKIEGVC